MRRTMYNINKLAVFIKLVTGFIFQGYLTGRPVFLVSLPRPLFFFYVGTREKKRSGQRDYCFSGPINTHDQ